MERVKSRINFASVLVVMSLSSKVDHAVRKYFEILGFFKEFLILIEKIEPKEYINKYLEYGLCTQIDSDDSATAQDGVCPAPLTCQARNDKYVCSCGMDKFRDLDNSSQCGK